MYCIKEMLSRYSQPLATYSTCLKEVIVFVQKKSKAFYDDWKA